MNIPIRTLTVKSDERGILFEILRSEHVEHTGFGQILITTATPGMKKGGHYHKRKKEWYCVLKGHGLLTLRDLNTNESKSVELHGNIPSVVEMPIGIFHEIENIGKEDLMLLVYISEEYNPNDPDTYTM